MSSIERQAFALLVGLAAMWGLLFVPIKYGAEHYPPLIFVTVRFAMALLALTLIRSARLNGARLPPGGARLGGLAGCLYGAGFLLQTYGLIYTGAGKAAFIIGLYVVFVPLLGFLFGRRPVGALGTLSVAMSVVGLSLMSLDTGAALGTAGPGDLLCVAAALFFALHILAIDRWGAAVDSVSFTWVQVLAITPLVGAASLLTEGVPAMDPELLLLGAGTGLTANVIGLIGMVWAQKHLPPTTIGLVLATEPVYAALSSWLIMGEAFSAQQMAGMALLLGATLIVPFAAFREARPLPENS